MAMKKSSKTQQQKKKKADNKIGSKNQLDSFLKKASEKIGQGKEVIEQELKDRGITDYVEKTANKAAQSNVGQQVIKFKEDTSENLDKLSGKKILELVENNLELQNEYNDILAIKLDEALERISILESKK